MIEVIVEAVEPRVRLQSGYRAKLAEGARITVAHLRELGRLPLAPIVLSRAAWAVDPYVRSFFGNAAEVTECISRSDDVRRFFEQHPDCNEAHALLGMKCTERQVLAPRMEGGVVRQEVAQTTVSFSEHRLIAPAADEALTRLEVGRRIVERLAQLVLARIVAVEQRAKELAHQQAHLMMKRRLLQGGRNGLQALMIAPAASSSSWRTSSTRSRIRRRTISKPRAACPCSRATSTTSMPCWPMPSSRSASSVSTCAST